MSILDSITKHFHDGTASITGMAASITVPVADLTEKIIVGIAVGVGTWICTKTISFLLSKLRKPCSKD